VVKRRWKLNDKKAWRNLTYKDGFVPAISSHRVVHGPQNVNAKGVNRYAGCARLDRLEVWCLAQKVQSNGCGTAESEAKSHQH
jgi:hypothetical protein